MRITALSAVVLSASACSSLPDVPSVPDWVDPTTWFGDDSPAPTSDNGQTPDIASLPNRPNPQTTPDDQQQTAEIARCRPQPCRIQCRCAARWDGSRRCAAAQSTGRCHGRHAQHRFCAHQKQRYAGADAPTHARCTIGTCRLRLNRRDPRFPAPCPPQRQDRQRRGRKWRLWRLWSNRLPRRRSLSRRPSRHRPSLRRQRARNLPFRRVLPFRSGCQTLRPRMPL